jgi:hypothetical protein
MNNRPDPHILATARLVENLAVLVPQVRRHVQQELGILDSIRDHTVGAGPAIVKRSDPLSRNCAANVVNPIQPDELITCGRIRPCPEHDSPVTLTPAERSAEERIRLNNWLADVEASCKLIAQATLDALRNGRKLSGSRAAIAVPRCRDGQVGKEGTIEWGDTTCQDGQVKAGLCNKHWQRWYRWRRANGIDTTRMFEPAVSKY